ncbi:hypothetical protein RvY_02448 [Ramazzottius varieornatus]|uniref:HECT domain-containing protein n=1 Tax=Ramazzottius varieornatus TaxID=947166 RepID=A0A1D1UUV6_RAMVA|nr:hypothetical protein RvY_02448 [Ramazzottius varieornatus]
MQVNSDCLNNSNPLKPGSHSFGSVQHFLITAPVKTIARPWPSVLGCWSRPAWTVRQRIRPPCSAVAWLILLRGLEVHHARQLPHRVRPSSQIANGYVAEYFGPLAGCKIRRDKYKNAEDNLIFHLIFKMEHPSRAKVVLLAWGNSREGQLGFGSSEKYLIVEPEEVKAFQNQEINVRDVAAGRSHSLFVSADGGLWSCGTNDYSQLGRTIESGSLRKPGRIPSLENHIIIQAAAGSAHSLALSDVGQVFSWGHNNVGQCGRSSDEESTCTVPRLIKTLARHTVIQICAGEEFCVALTDKGEVYAWGSNSTGQLGLKHMNPVTSPTLVESLAGLPIKEITSGGAHSLILTMSGTVFSTGKNDFGQLGLGDTINRSSFTAIESLCSQRVAYVCCGQEHSVALTLDGGVFTFGAGGMGQLGHGQISNDQVPRKIFELMGSQVTQIAAGRFHTLAFVQSSMRLFAFGLSGSGQLGLGSSTGKNVLSPALVTKFATTAQMNKIPNGPVYLVKEVFAGGDQTFVLAYNNWTSEVSRDFTRGRRLKRIAVLDKQRVQVLTEALRDLKGEDSLLDTEMNRELEVMVGSASSWNGSFLGPGDEHYTCVEGHSGVMVQEARVALKELATDCNLRTREQIKDQIERLLIPSLPAKPIDVECLRLFLLLPLCPVLTEPLDHDRVMNGIVPLAHALTRIPFEKGKILMSWLANVPVDIFEIHAQLYRNAVAVLLRQPNLSQLFQQSKYHTGVQALLSNLEMLFDTNSKLRQPTSQICYEAFYIPEIAEKVHIPMDYKNWYDAPDEVKKRTMSFCNYPFVFDPSAKTILLRADAERQMQQAVSSLSQFDVMANIMRAATEGRQQDGENMSMPTSLMINPHQALYLNLYVTRENLLTDTLNQLYHFHPQELKRPLKIWFKGEEGEDAGGVKKEFFMLLMRELLDPKYGMFTYYEEARTIYFNGNSFELDTMFGVVGVLCGLAIYNGVIVDVHFPLAVFKKLLGIKPVLADLDGLMPTVRRGLTQMLEYEGDDLESVFSLNFTVTNEYLGHTSTVELMPGGENISVTKENRAQYVDLYVDHIFNKSVEKQFGHFATGFQRVCGGKILNLFHPQELMAMVCGNENYDWRELEKDTTYKGVFHAEHPTIRMFWKVFHSLSLENKKRFLMYLTGSDRIPILGMKSIKLVIQPMGDEKDTNHLPVAHTCFNILDLPQYQDMESLRNKLLFAIEHTQGFGIV